MIQRYILLAICIFIFSCNQKQSEKPAIENRKTLKHYPRFDGRSAFQYLTAQTQFGPRNPNSSGHQQCLNYLAAELKKFADSVVLQSFTEQGYNETLKLTNVFASFKPHEEKRILLLAHWDTRPRADMEVEQKNKNSPIVGANDGASGVAVLLELARVMKEHSPLVGVDILLTDGEDYGSSERDGNDNLYFLGVKYFARTKSLQYTPQFGILLDMVGDRDLQLPMEQNSMRYAPTVMELVWNAAEEIGATQFIHVPGEAISDDHLALNEAGIPTIDIIDFQYPYWHTHQDTADKCSPESLEAVGKVLSFLIYTKM